MAFLEKLNGLREKANRLGINTDADQRQQDRNAEARGRLEAGRQTLTAILDGNTEQLRSRVSAMAGQGEAVGKLTQVMTDVAPALQQHTAEIQHVVQQIDSAKAELGAAGQLPQAAGRVEAAMGTLLERANLPANVLPRNVLADLVHDATEDNTPRTNNNTEVPPQPSTGTDASPANKPASTGKRKKRRGDDDAARPTATGRGALRDVARKTGFLDSFRAPSNLASIVSNPAAAVTGMIPNPAAAVSSTVGAPAGAIENAMSSLTSAPGAAVNNAVSSLTSAPAAAVNNAISSAVGGLGGLGGLGGGGIPAPPPPADTGLVDRATPSSGTSSKKGGAGKALGILGGAVRAFGINTGPVSIDSEGISVTAGGEGANASVTLGADGDVSVAGELSRETPLGTVSLTAEHSLSDGSNSLTAGLAHDTPLGEVSLQAELDDSGGGSVSIDTPAGSIPLAGDGGGDESGEGGGGLADMVGGVLGGGGLGGILGGVGGGDAPAAPAVAPMSFAPAAPTASPAAPPPAPPSAPAAAPTSSRPANANSSPATSTSDTDFSDVASADNAPSSAGSSHAAFVQPASYTQPAAFMQPAAYMRPAVAYMQPASLLQPATYRPAEANNGGALQPAVNRGRTFDTARAIRTARSDNARGGYCAKGVANVLTAQGFPVARGNATDWWRTLPQLGWSKLEGATPSTAPEGAVLVFTNNRQAGRRVTRRRGGQLYGHVEIVGISGGRRVYISDAVRNNFGGTVPQNFKGAYVFGQAAASAPQLLQASNRSPGEGSPAAAAPAAPTLAGANTLRIA